LGAGFCLSLLVVVFLFFFLLLILDVILLDVAVLNVILLDIILLNVILFLLFVVEKVVVFLRVILQLIVVGGWGRRGWLRASVRPSPPSGGYSWGIGRVAVVDVAWRRRPLVAHATTGMIGSVAVHYGIAIWRATTGVWKSKSLG
jgi:hypothetical protein